MRLSNLIAFCALALMVTAPAAAADMAGKLARLAPDADPQVLRLALQARACALQAAMPRDLYRFQRRGAYRVRTMERSSPMARLRHPSIPDMVLSLRVLPGMSERRRGHVINISSMGVIGSGRCNWYRSIVSTPRRRSDASQARRM